MSGKGEKKRRRALDAYSRMQRAAAMSAVRVEQATQTFGLTASQFGVLDTLHARGSVHQQELAVALGRSKAQMTAIIDALEARELVRRERHATDRRFMTIHLTPLGERLHAEATPARATAIVELMSELTGEQRARLARLCRRLLKVLDPTDLSGDELEDDADDSEDTDDASRASATIILPHSESAHDAAPRAPHSSMDALAHDTVIDETPPVDVA